MNFFHIVLANACFNNPVGVADPGVIPDEHMTASTQLSFRQAIHGRLNGNRNGGGGWCTENCCESQEWLQVDLGQTTEICGVATQGNVLFGAYATSFKLSFSRDRSSWNFYKDTDGVSEKVTFELTLHITVYKAFIIWECQWDISPNITLNLETLKLY